MIVGILLALAAGAAAHAGSDAEWQRVELDQTGASLGRSRLAFTRAMRDARRLEGIDRCMIAWVLDQPDPAHAPPAIFRGKLELRVESTDTTATVSRATVVEASEPQSYLSACIARALEGPLAVSFEPGFRRRAVSGDLPSADAGLLSK